MFRSHSTVLLTLLLVGCPDACGTKEGDCDPNDVEPSAIVEDTSESGYGCRLDFNYCDDAGVLGVYVEGHSNDPDGGKIKGPEECDPAGGFQPAETFTSTDGDWAFGSSSSTSCLPPGVGHYSRSLICSTATQAGADSWEVFMPSVPGQTCEEAYGDVTMTFITDDDPCADEATTTGLTGATCTPTVDHAFDLAYRRVSDSDGDGDLVARLLPITRVGAAPSERAWIRKITVTDWGDATELLASGHGQLWSAPDDIVDRSTSVSITPAQSTRTFAPGQITIDTVWSMDGISDTQMPFTPPTIALDWTCQSNSSNPHYQTVDYGPTYAIGFDQLGLPGVAHSQRLVVSFPDNATARLSLEGRVGDSVNVELTDLGNGRHGFDLESVTEDVVAKGIIRQVEGNRRVDFLTLTVKGIDLGTPSWTLTPQ